MRNYKEEWIKYGKPWCHNNPHKIWLKNHSDLNKAKQARYRERHREEIRLRSLAYNKRRINESLEARIAWLLRSRVNGAIKKCKGTKAYKTMVLIGCSLQKVREHLESQFKKDMNWKNHGKVWEIDHIKPVSMFNMLEVQGQKEAFNYTNLQPLYWLDNRKKSNKIVV